MSLDNKLFQIAINNKKPATEIMINFLNNLKYITLCRGYMYSDRKSHLKVIAYHITKSHYEN
jgi:hypothetical protein